MSNEAFRLLSRGGIVFDKSKSRRESEFFNVGSNMSLSYSTHPPYKKTVPARKTRHINADVDWIPSELDFFKYAQGHPVKRQLPQPGNSREKRRKICSDKATDTWSEEKLGYGGQTGSKERSHRVTTKGAEVPVHVDSFDALKGRYYIPAHLFANLAASGYHEPTSVQSYCAPIFLENRDMVTISPTGTGKTLAYLLPIFSCLKEPSSSYVVEACRGARALIVVPTRELAHQIHNECLKMAQGRKWKIVLFSKAALNALSDTRAREKVDIIISTPLRLLAALQAGNLNLDNVRHLVLDEADRLLDTEFISQVQEIVAECTHTNLQTALFSATLPAGAEEIGMKMLHDPVRIVVGLKDTPLPLIAQSLTYVADDPSKLPSILSYLTQPYDPPILVFVSTQTRATSLTEELVLNGIPNVDCLHAGMTKKEREDAISRMRQGASWIMVTTEVMARGMDFRGVREVINYDFPTSAQSYIHRIGRTGRAGREGKAVTFFTDEDAPYLKTVANVILQSGFSVPEWMLKLPKPSKMKRRQMGKVKRPDMVNLARRPGRREAIKKREMILGSRRRNRLVNAKGNQSGGPTQVVDDD